MTVEPIRVESCVAGGAHVQQFGMLASGYSADMVGVQVGGLKDPTAGLAATSKGLHQAIMGGFLSHPEHCTWFGGNRPLWLVPVQHAGAQHFEVYPRPQRLMALATPFKASV